MDKETAKAINTLSIKLNEITQRLDTFINMRCNNITANNITTDNGLIELANIINEHDKTIKELINEIQNIKGGE